MAREAREHIYGFVFADIVHSSAIDSMESRAKIQRHIDQFVQQVATTPDVMCRKYSGDGIQLFVSTGKAAAEMGLRLRDHFNSFRWASISDERHGLRIGVHVGLVQEHERPDGTKDYNGPEIDLCARIEPITIPGTVWCSKAVADELTRSPKEHAAAVLDLGEIELPKGHGKAQLFQLHWASEPVAQGIESGQRGKASPGGDTPTSPAKDKRKGGTPAAGKDKEQTEAATAVAACDMNGACLEILHKMICWNQGQIINHLFLAGEKHKELRGISARKPNLQKEKMEDFTFFLQLRMQIALRQNFDFARQLFALKKGADCVPRFAFKYHRRKPDTGQPCIYSTNVGDDIRYRDQFESEVSSNTASQHVENLGAYYLQNNIPEAVAAGAYLNPRLDPILALSYAEKSATPRPFQAHRPMTGHWDDDWVSCWRKIQGGKRGGETPPPRDSCYKSTLVIPCTLKNNDLDDPTEFWTRLTKKATENGLFWWRGGDLLTAQRQVYAYLCLDYPEINYFDKVVDVRVGYIVADILSLYFFINQMYTAFSGTVRKIESAQA